MSYFSLHTFCGEKDGQPVIVQLTYDPHLNHFACYVTGHDGEAIYRSFDDLHAPALKPDVRYFDSVLRCLQIDVPQSMFEAMEKDQWHRATRRTRTLRHFLERPPALRQLDS